MEIVNVAAGHSCFLVLLANLVVMPQPPPNSHQTFEESLVQSEWCVAHHPDRRTWALYTLTSHKPPAQLIYQQWYGMRKYPISRTEQQASLASDTAIDRLIRRPPDFGLIPHRNPPRPSDGPVRLTTIWEETWVCQMVIFARLEERFVCSEKQKCVRTHQQPRLRAKGVDTYFVRLCCFHIHTYILRIRMYVAFSPMMWHSSHPVQVEVLLLSFCLFDVRRERGLCELENNQNSTFEIITWGANTQILRLVPPH